MKLAFGSIRTFQERILPDGTQLAGWAALIHALELRAAQPLAWHDGAGHTTGGTPVPQSPSGLRGQFDREIHSAKTLSFREYAAE